MKRSRRVSQKTILWGWHWAGASSRPQDEKTRNYSLRRCRMLQFRTYDAAERQEPFPLCPLRSTAIRSPRTPKNDGMQRAGAADRCHDLFVKWMMDDWLIDTLLILRRCDSSRVPEQRAGKKTNKKFWHFYDSTTMQDVFTMRRRTTTALRRRRKAEVKEKGHIKKERHFNKRIEKRPL